MRAGVERKGVGDACGIGDDGARPQHYACELTGAISILRHQTAGSVLIFRHHDAGVGAEMQKPQHVARGERRDQQFFGRVARRVAAESHVG